MINKISTSKTLNDLSKIALIIPAFGLLSCGSGKNENNTQTSDTTSVKREEVVQAEVAPIEYKSVKIGDQIWMAENYNTVTFRNGDTIPQAITSEDWTEAGRRGKPAWCYYDNKEEGSRLYNFFAVTDSRGFAPEGWEMPTLDDYEILIKYLGGIKVAAIKLKDTEGWNDGGNGNNESGFSARPEGMRNFLGAFSYKGEFGYWWTKSDRIKSNAWQMSLGVKNNIINPSFSQQANGFNVRCIKK